MMTDDERAAAAVFGAVINDGAGLLLSPHVAAAWAPGRGESPAWASIRSAVTRFVRQVLVSTTTPEVEVIGADTVVARVTRAYTLDHVGKP